MKRLLLKMLIKRYRPTDAEIDFVCLTYRHDFGLLSAYEKGRIKRQAIYFLEAWKDVLSKS